MRIKVVSGTGEASTKIGAFDKALHDAGIGDHVFGKIKIHKTDTKNA